MITKVDNKDGTYIIEADCPHCGKHIDEVIVKDHDECIVCSACGGYIDLD